MRKIEQALEELALLLSLGYGGRWGEGATYQKNLVPDARRELANLFQLRALDEYHEDYGNVLWWVLPISEPPYVGSPLDCNWPGYHTHWTKIPIPNEKTAK